MIFNLTKAIFFVLVMMNTIDVVAQKSNSGSSNKTFISTVKSSGKMESYLPNAKEPILIFSAVRGTVGKNRSYDYVATESGKISVAIKGEGASNFKLVGNNLTQIIKEKKVAFNLQFTPSADFIGITTAQVEVRKTSGALLLHIALRGLSLKGLEGENEPTLETVFKILGYGINNGWTTLANNVRPTIQGEEVAVNQFKKAGIGKVEIIPVARFSPDFELPFGYYTNNENGPQLHQVGILSKTEDLPQHQTLFPEVKEGATSFDPGKTSFGFYNTGPTHTSYSSDVWNALLHPSNALHAARIYPAKTSEGNPIPNTYLLCFEEAKNGDYNDYVFLINNVMPVVEANDTKALFNGKNFDGWDIFLKGKELNNDNEGNFSIEDGVVHVRGKELGYIRTKENFTDYSFSVDFKWGERRWAPREKDKRDAGICYNIPPNEADSIWPQSIECQIQEGDVGDFWLLGFSTITVNDSTNKPTNHTRMMKKTDAEKPYGEWNRVEVISYKGRCIHIVNGVVVNEGEKASVASGRILLQSEYAEVYYKNATIRKL